MTEIYLQVSMSLRAALASIGANVRSTVHAATLGLLRHSDVVQARSDIFHDARISKACAYQLCMAAKVQFVCPSEYTGHKCMLTSIAL